MELLLPWGLPWKACGPNLLTQEFPTSQVPGNSTHPSAHNLLPDLGRPWPWPLGRTLVAWRLVQWIGGYCQRLGVISEDPIRNGRRTLSTSPVSDSEIYTRKTTPVLALQSSSHMPPNNHPEIPKRPSECVSSVPTSEGKHLGTGGDTVPDLTTWLLRKSFYGDPHIHCHIWQSFLNHCQFMEQSLKKHSKLRPWEVPQLLLFN